MKTKIKDRFIDFMLDTGMIKDYMQEVEKMGYKFDDMFEKMVSKNQLDSLINGVYLIIQDGSDDMAKRRQLNQEWLKILESEFSYSTLKLYRC